MGFALRMNDDDATLPRECLATERISIDAMVLFLNKVSKEILCPKAGSQKKNTSQRYIYI